MKTINLTKRSALRLTVLSLLVLAALVVLVPREAGAELVVRANLGPVQIMVHTPTVIRCGSAPGPRVVLRSAGRRGHGSKCRCTVGKSYKPHPKRAVWINGHYEVRRHQGKVWIPGHWLNKGHGKRHGCWEKHGQGRLHR